MDKVLLTDQNGNPVPVFMPGTTEILSPSAGSAATAAVIDADNNHIIQIVSDAQVWIKMGDTAANTDMYLPADVVIYYIVPANTKVAAYGTGKVYITLHAN